jgi:hypothetical protein
MENSIYIKVANYTFSIEFKNAVLDYSTTAKAQIIADINKTYHPFTIPKPNITNLKIVFKEKFELMEKQLNNKKQIYINFYSRIKSGEIEMYYGVSILQFDFVLRSTLMDLLKTEGGLLLHSSGVLNSNKAYLFMGPQEAGKSTTMTNLNSTFPAFADDSTIVKYSNNRYLCYQTPFIEKAKWIARTGFKEAALRRVYVLHKAPSFKIVPIKKVEQIVALLTAQSWINNNHSKKQIALIYKLSKSKNLFFNLYAKKDKSGLINLITNHNNESR